MGGGCGELMGSGPESRKLMGGGPESRKLMGSGCGELRESFDLIRACDSVQCSKRRPWRNWQTRWI